MQQARRHERALAGLALGLLALVAELSGRSLTHRLDVGRHVGRVAYQHEHYYPFLLAGVKVAMALMLARLTWRFVKARATARAALRVTTALGARSRSRAPRVRIELSARLWLLSFVGTSLIYLVQTDAEQAASGRWRLLAPLLHTSALPVFALLAVVVAVLFRSVARWLREYEDLAADAVSFLRRLCARRAPEPTPHQVDVAAPRRLFGFDFESRPPPLPA